jgi:hypothetical protein
LGIHDIAPLTDVPSPMFSEDYGPLSVPESPMAFARGHDSLQPRVSGLFQSSGKYDQFEYGSPHHGIDAFSAKPTQRKGADNLSQKEILEPVVEENDRLKKVIKQVF